MTDIILETRQKFKELTTDRVPTCLIVDYGESEKSEILDDLSHEGLSVLGSKKISKLYFRGNEVGLYRILKKMAQNCGGKILEFNPYQRRDEKRVVDVKVKINTQTILRKIEFSYHH